MLTLPLLTLRRRRCCENIPFWQAVLRRFLMEFTQMKAMTLAELAKRAGVGVATVDRVLNDRGGVSPAMTKKVLHAAREAGLKRILPEEHRHAWQIEVLLKRQRCLFLSSAGTGFCHTGRRAGLSSLTPASHAYPGKCAGKTGRAYRSQQ